MKTNFFIHIAKERLLLFSVRMLSQQVKTLIENIVWIENISTILNYIYIILKCIQMTLFYNLQKKYQVIFLQD